MVLTIKNFESQNVGPGVVETAPTNLVGVAGTLKATLTWTSATGESGVIWSEEKLVRKEGSAPTGSMDGTTVATITTKDTYATNGYEDTGLDSTKTYYYKVFAVYDNGTERGSTDVNVTPDAYEFIPSSTTYCYCPLESDYLDYSGNNIPVTSDLTSFGVNDMFPGGTGKYVRIPQSDIITNNKAWTILFWVYPIQKNNMSTLMETSKRNSHKYNERGALVELFPDDNLKFNLFGNIGGDWSNWNLIILRQDVTGFMELSVNSGQFVNYNTRYESSVNNLPIWFGRHVIYTTSGYPYGLLGQMKDIIVETKCWSNDECLAYYNGTKGNYGL